MLAPLEHHTLILSPFYALTRTTPVTTYDDELNPMQLPVQTFRGYGTELGYRYYSGQGGLRGFFAGPSLIISSFTATAQNGSKTPYLDYGLAGDIGYEALVVDRVSLSLGLGLQYTTTNKSIPEQMALGQGFPAVTPRSCPACSALWWGMRYELAARTRQAYCYSARFRRGMFEARPSPCGRRRPCTS